MQGVRSRRCYFNNLALLMQIILEVGDRVVIKKTLDPNEKSYMGKVGVITRIRLLFPDVTVYSVNVTNRKILGVKCIEVTPVIELK